jgi:3-oxoacyl-[acyl-carrier protein] reductase
VNEQPDPRPVALVTGAGRRAGIAAAVCLDLAADGWDVAFTYWQPYDRRMAWGDDAAGPALLDAALRDTGARTISVEADLSGTDSVPQLFEAVEAALGPVTALVIGHCESVDSDILGTTVDSFDRHMAVNARAPWLLVRELATRYRGAFGAGRIVALTSDATVRNLPYGASKGALDRIVLAAARELADLGITANVVNPGPVDTGWIPSELAEAIVADTPLRRLGTPADAAALVTFLCSARGGWVNGQLLHSDGGLHS